MLQILYQNWCKCKCKCKWTISQKCTSQKCTSCFWTKVHLMIGQKCTCGLSRVVLKKIYFQSGVLFKCI
eukprot:UN04621